MADRADVIVAGAGIAGLVAARTLRRAGADVLVLEARAEVGGRARSTRLEDHVAELGGKWVGRGHRRMRRLARAHGLTLRPAGNLGRPVLWRAPGGQSVGRLPPAPVRIELARVLVSAARRSRGVDSRAPWNGPEAPASDTRSVADWLDELGIGADTRYLLERLIGALSSGSVDAMSLLHFLWWMRLAGGPLRTLHTTFQWRIREGAQELPRRLARDVRVVLDAPVERIEQGAGGVEVTAGGASFTARRAIVAVPLSHVDRIALVPPVPAAREHRSVAIGAGTKVVALLPDGHEPAHTTVLGGELLAGAWRAGRRVMGVAAPPQAGCGEDVLAGDLAAAFGVAAADLRCVRTCRWADERYIPGCDVAFAPGEVSRFGPGLAAPAGALGFAGAERSAWPNNMEGAAQSGERGRGDRAALTATPAPGRPAARAPARRASSATPSG